jgi:hypothetical protein
MTDLEALQQVLADAHSFVSAGNAANSQKSGEALKQVSSFITKAGSGQARFLAKI